MSDTRPEGQNALGKDFDGCGIYEEEKKWELLTYFASLIVLPADKDLPHGHLYHTTVIE